MIELAQRVCMGEHIPPLKDGPPDTMPEMRAMKAAVDQIDAFFAPHIARINAHAASEADEDGDVEPWSTT